MRREEHARGLVREGILGGVDWRRPRSPPVALGGRVPELTVLSLL